MSAFARMACTRVFHDDSELSGFGESYAFVTQEVAHRRRGSDQVQVNTYADRII